MRRFDSFRTLALAVAIALPLPATLAAQDPFEIQVYEYMTVPRGRWDLEVHYNHVWRGTKVPEGSVAKTAGQNHLTFEFTRGITNYFEVAGYVLMATRAGVDGEFAGWRFRPRFRLPEDLLPVKISVSTEFGFPKHAYEENDITFELRPIIEKELGRWLFDVNPTVGTALRGPSAAEGWDFEPAVRVGYSLNATVDLSMEYYGGTGSLTDPLPGSEQTHQFFPGADINFSPNVVWNVGVGFGTTNAGNPLVFKTRLGWIF